MLQERGLPRLTAARYAELFDFPVIDYYRKLGFDFAREPFEIVGTEFIHRYEPRRHEAALQPAALDVLRALQARGATQSVLSAYRHETLETFLRHFQVRELFTRVIGSDDNYASGKIEQGRRFIAELACDPGDVVLIGDTTHDHEVAEAMGIACLLIPAGHQSRARLESCGVQVLAGLGELV